MTPSAEKRNIINSLGIKTKVHVIRPYLFEHIPSPGSDFQEKNALFVSGLITKPNVDLCFFGLHR